MPHTYRMSHCLQIIFPRHCLCTLLFFLWKCGTIKTDLYHNCKSQCTLPCFVFFKTYFCILFSPLKHSFNRAPKITYLSSLPTPKCHFTSKILGENIRPKCYCLNNYTGQFQDMYCVNNFTYRSNKVFFFCNTTQSQPWHEYIG